LQHLLAAFDAVSPPAKAIFQRHCRRRNLPAAALMPSFGVDFQRSQPISIVGLILFWI
jgi:hypothetical protein